MRQIMVSPYQDDTTFSQRQKRLMGLFSGLLLAALEVALILDIFYFKIYYFRIHPRALLGGIALLYFVAPIPLSLYVSRKTDEIMEGWKTGSMAGCIGALFTILAVGVYIFATGRMFPGLGTVVPEPPRIDAIFLVFMIFAFLNALGAILSLLGAAIGSALGKISKIRVHSALK